MQSKKDLSCDTQKDPHRSGAYPLRRVSALTRFGGVALIGLVTALSVACNDGTGFSGSASKNTATKKKAESKKGDAGLGRDGDQTEPEDLEKNANESDSNNAGKGTGSTQEEARAVQLPPPEKCDPASGATFANLLSPLVVLGTNTAEVVYEISITDCTGKVKNINAETISFDFDGEIGGLGIGAVLQYRLVAEGVTHSGVLEARDGQDLFGNKGPDFYHFITTQKVSTSTKASAVRLAISLANKDVKPRGLAPGASTGEFKLKTFLKFGAATPVTKEVTFRPFGSK